MFDTFDDPNNPQFVHVRVRVHLCAKRDFLASIRGAPFHHLKEKRTPDNEPGEVRFGFYVSFKDLDQVVRIISELHDQNPDLIGAPVYEGSYSLNEVNWGDEPGEEASLPPLFKDFSAVFSQSPQYYDESQSFQEF